MKSCHFEKIADGVFLSLHNDDSSTAYWSHNNDLSHEACAKMLSTHPVVEQFVLGLGRYKYIPLKHSMQKSEDPHHGRLVVGRVRDVNGIILSTEIGASRRNDDHNEISLFVTSIS
jgi:hypothetical protein